MAFEIREQNGKKAVFKDGKQITEWFDWVWSSGLVQGQSNYFIAEKDRKQAIYEYKNGQIIKITKDFKRISINGLIQGMSNYFKVEDNGNDTIYHKLLNKKISLNTKIENYNQNKELTVLPLISGKC